MMEFKINNYFETPIYTGLKKDWVKKFNKLSDPYIKNSSETDYQSDSLLPNNNFKPLKDYIGINSWNILDHMGFDLSHYELFFTELWVLEFSKSGGGHQDAHVHSDNHISGFYFLKCSNKTSYPVFYDPRPGALMSKLILKDTTKAGTGSEKINYKPEPGTFIFFPSYLKHYFVLDKGKDPFRFIHFNLQAVRKEIVKRK
ncbi:MAG TPA: hypothetical protein DCS66_08885 [Flavobacteriaceae bacterium]|nr:hypothetical protein [Flavobacteriaceae bacterium]|tara:strand:+ start:761 stop:1360 length:600 start_codon:yes stop_codon:yes gene_type:complete